MPEFRHNKGLHYPCGLLAFSLLLCECASSLSQRSKEIWLELNWRWVKKLWRKGSEKRFTHKASPSQSTISRFLAEFDEEKFSLLLDQLQRNNFYNKWQKYTTMNKNKATSRRLKRQGKRGKKKSPLLPHYSFDGKARKGCISRETGRTEVDITLFSSDTKQVLAKRTLADKEGERNGVRDILKKEARLLPSGIMTGDAGILCPNTVAAINAAGHSYLMHIKGNAGEAFAEIKDLPWDKVKVKYEDFCEGHGRQEIRMLKSIHAEFADFIELEKYSNIAIVYQLETWVHHVKDDKYSKELKYFIGDQDIANQPLNKVLHYIRSHWQQESYHWIKDVIMKEDDSPHKSKNGSRILGTIRSYVVYVGKEVCGSVKRFLDYFGGAPEKTVKNH